MQTLKRDQVGLIVVVDERMILQSPKHKYSQDYLMVLDSKYVDLGYWN